MSLVRFTDISVCGDAVFVEASEVILIQRHSEPRNLESYSKISMRNGTEILVVGLPSAVAKAIRGGLTEQRPRKIEKRPAPTPPGSEWGEK